MKSKLGWGILGTGSIAGIFANGVKKSQLGRLAAVGSRSKKSADAFADKWGVPNRYGSYEELLADTSVEAVYIAVLHPMHAEWSIKAAEAGKHILCEKPLTLNHADAMVVIEAARRHDVFLMEAFMYRCHPQTLKLVELIRKKVIGEVRVINACFSFRAGFDPESRVFNNALGGGGILDVGCYTTSMARLVAGVALGQDFAEPLEIKGAGCVGGESRVDEWAVAVMKFPGDIVAQIATGVALGQDNVVRIFGTEGSILVPDPWIPSREGGTTKIIVNRKGKKKPQEIAIQAPPLYSIEADTVASSIAARQAPPPAMTWEDTLGNMKSLDAWRASIGMVYDSEKPEAGTPPAHGRALALRKEARMTYGRVPGVELQVSRLIMGVDNQVFMPHANAMFDDFFERGGNCFDSAYIYGGGKCEEMLGHWLASRGVREQVVILDKGAHTPECYPEALTRQLMISLDRLQTNYVDIYMMHRDNTDIPVDEFVDVLNEHKKAGRIRAFGGSNWTIARIEAFNACAKEKGLTGFAAISNNFSLARMKAPPWDDCLSASDPESRAWFEKTQMPLMPWSSQAGGFFVRGHPDFQKDIMLTRCWYSADNFKRQERAREMAEKHGVLPTSIALAYVLCQPFPTFPLIGPRLISETRTSMQALDIQLTRDECLWLNLDFSQA